MDVHGPDYLIGVWDKIAIDRVSALPLTFPAVSDKLSVPTLNATRASFSAPVERNESTEWLYERVWELFVVFNRHYELQIECIEEPIHVIRYLPSGEVGWHVDGGELFDGLARKLSLSIQLTPKDAYAGGNLEFGGIPVEPFSRVAGSAICFPSYCVHRVTPVTDGTRHSLVAFALGQPFK